MNKAGTNAGMVQERTRLANTALNSCAFVGQVGATVMHTQVASGLPNWHYRAIDLPINPNIIQGLGEIWHLLSVGLRLTLNASLAALEWVQYWQCSLSNIGNRLSYVQDT